MQAGASEDRKAARLVETGPGNPARQGGALEAIVKVGVSETGLWGF